jgi:hypothetical protein
VSAAPLAQPGRVVQNGATSIERPSATEPGAARRGYPTTRRRVTNGSARLSRTHSAREPDYNTCVASVTDAMSQTTATAERPPPRLATCRTVTTDGLRQPTKEEVDHAHFECLRPGDVGAGPSSRALTRLSGPVLGASRRSVAPRPRASTRRSPAAAHTPAPPRTQRIVTTRRNSRASLNRVCKAGRVSAAAAAHGPTRRGPASGLAPRVGAHPGCRCGRRQCVSRSGTRRAPPVAVSW